MIVLENIYRKLSFTLCHAAPRRSGKAAGRQRVRCRMAGRRLAQPVARGRLSAFAAAGARPASPPAGGENTNGPAPGPESLDTI